jgi:hypothetical protein
MRLTFLAAGLGLLISAPLHAQPIIVPLSPQPQRQPPPPPPPSPVPVAPPQGAAGARPPVVFNGGNAQQRGYADGTARGAGVPAGQPPVIAAPPPQ